MTDGTGSESGKRPDEDRRRRNRAWRAAHPDLSRAYNRQWRENNPDKVAESRRAWRAANLDRSRELNRESMRRQSARKKKLREKRAKGRAWYAEHRDEQRERARRFREQNPERIREYQRRWREKDLDHAREVNRRGNQAYKDRHGEEVRARGRRAAAARRERDPDTFKKWYEENLEAQRARGREASKQRSRLKQLGLPPRKIQRVYAEQKRANARAADEFFAQRRTKDEVRHAADPKAGALQRTRTFDLVEQNLEERRAEDSFLLRLPALISTHRARYGERIRGDVTLDSAARVAAGKPPYDIDQETGNRLLREIVAREAPLLNPERIAQLSSVMRKAKSQISTTTEPESAVGVASGTDAAASESHDEPGSAADAMEWVKPHVRAGMEIPGFYRRRRTQ